MRRTILLVGVVVSCLVAGVAIRRWWTAPPAADAAALAGALRLASGDADGALALASPARAARWLARRPQALALALLAAPGARDAFSRLGGAPAALAREARGPLAVWWRGRELAVGARVDSGAAPALARVAELSGLPVRAAPAGPGEAAVAIASAPALLRGEPLESPPLPAGPLAAAARCGRRWWVARAERDRLELDAGAAPELPADEDGDLLVTSDLAALLAPLAPLPAASPIRARLLWDREAWALELPGVAAGGAVARLLGVEGGGAAAVRRGRGVLGEVWARGGDGLVMASTAGMLARLDGPAPAGELGRVRGPELASLCERAAAALDGLPWTGGHAAALRRAAPLAAALRLARWRLLPEGGRIELGW